MSLQWPIAMHLLHKVDGLEWFAPMQCRFEPGAEGRLVEDYIREINAFRDAHRMEGVIRALMEENADSIKRLRTMRKTLKELGEKHPEKSWPESASELIALDMALLKEDQYILSDMRSEVKRAMTVHYGEVAKAAALLEAVGRSAPRLVRHSDGSLVRQYPDQDY